VIGKREVEAEAAYSRPPPEGSWSAVAGLKQVYLRKIRLSEYCESSRTGDAIEPCAPALDCPVHRSVTRRSGGMRQNAVIGPCRGSTSFLDDRARPRRAVAAMPARRRRVRPTIRAPVRPPFRASQSSARTAIGSSSNSPRTPGCLAPSVVTYPDVYRSVARGRRPPRSARPHETRWLARPRTRFRQRALRHLEGMGFESPCGQRSTGTRSPDSITASIGAERCRIVISPA
jgi:hypothetical protein